MNPERRTWLAAAAGIAGACLVFATAHSRQPIQSAPIALSWLPDDRLTPGQVATTNPDEICGKIDGLTYERRYRLYTTDRHAYWATVRTVLTRYGLPFEYHRRVQMDDRLPVSAGGRQGVLNWWPQPLNGSCNAEVKDDLDRQAKIMICDLHIEPQKVQAMFMAPTNWQDTYKLVFGHDCSKAAQ